MLKFECGCGSQDFAVNRHCSMIRCWDCGKRYALDEDKWVPLATPLKERAEELLQTTFEHLTHFPETCVETTGQFFKRLGITKPKKPKATEPAPSIPLVDDSHQPVYVSDCRWNAVLDELNRKGSVVFGKHEHYGKLRGRDAARAAHTYFNRVGFKTRLKFTKNWSARIEKIPEGCS